MVHRINLYVRDREKFHKLKSEVRALWFHMFHESLSTSATVERSLVLTRDYLQKNIDVVQQTKLNEFGRIHK